MILKGMPAGVSKHVPRSIVAYMRTSTYDRKIVNSYSLKPRLLPLHTHLVHILYRTLALGERYKNFILLIPTCECL